MSRAACFRPRSSALAVWCVALGVACTSSAVRRIDTQPAGKRPAKTPRDQGGGEKLFSVTDFGANGADEQDDTLAIQDAIDAATHASPSRVNIPSGTYYLSDQPPLDDVALRIDSVRGLTLRGAGADATTLTLQGGRDAHLISLSGCSDVEVGGLRLNGSRAGRKRTHGIRVADSQRLGLRELFIHDIAHYGIGLQRGALRAITIEHVRIDDTGGDGVDFKNTNDANESLVIRHVQVSRPGQVSPKQAGLDVRGPAQIVDVAVSEVPPGATGIRFREDGPDTGKGGHGSTLSEFRVEGDAESSGVAVAANGVSVRSGVILGTHTGVVILGAGARVTDVSVSGARYAFRIGVGARDVLLDSCSGTKSNAGLWLEGNDALVQGSSFSHNQRCGVCVRPSASNARLDSNSFTDNSVAIDDQGVLTRVLER